MEITIERFSNCWLPSQNIGYCIGRLSIDGQFFCHTLEPYDFGHTIDTPNTEIQRQKKICPCAIASGKYMIALHIWSPSFGKQDFYRDNCSGFLPRLMGVPGREGILIHCGNSPRDTNGCILVGENVKVGWVSDSRATFIKLYRLMKAAARNYEGIHVKVFRSYPM